MAFKEYKEYFAHRFLGIKKEIRSDSNNFLAGLNSVFSTSNSGVSITKKNAMTIAAVYSAIKVYANAISSLPVHIIKDDGTTKEKLFNHPVYKLLSREPNSLMTVSTFWNIVMQQILLYGNSYAIIEFARGSFRPISLLPVQSDLVEVEIKEGVLWYTFKLESGDIRLDQSNVLHFRNLGDNVMGTSVIDLARQNLGLGSAAEEFGSKFFGNGASMTGILESDAKLGAKAIENLRNSFNDINGGLANAHKPLVLEEGLKYKTVSIPPEQAQFLETRRYSIEDVARWFNLPNDKLKDLSKATFSNLEQQDLNFVKNSIVPYVISIEQELSRKLLRESEKSTTYFKMNVDGLLRGDIKTRTEAYKNLFSVGAISPNEIRNKEEMNPYKGGDSRFVQINSAPVDEEGTNQAQTEETNEPKTQTT